MDFFLKSELTKQLTKYNNIITSNNEAISPRPMLIPRKCKPTPTKLPLPIPKL
jgi:hypothetical protein